ncbi:hypothetical protein Celaphus_00009588 [Cervus elaphus hippelaphus]|uniref:MAGE domain-containing protein n=1 Tax=Cervus elaphus hippelaphus TaxID=46360 RepID=A0A212C0B7_CEREH|nr:hypothetical protein Celaphus_00009588 [Cervus elaphus hippelaphus]
MFMVEMSELSKPKEDLKGQNQAQGPAEAQLMGAEAEEASTPLASSCPISSSSTATHAESLLKKALNVMTAELLGFLLLKDGTKEPISQAKMLNTVLRDNQAHFPVVLCEATQCLPLVFGMYMKEVDPGEQIYFLVPTLGLTLNEMQRDGQGMPKAGLLVIDLSLILLAGDLTLRRRELLTQVWEREGYQECQQVPDSDPAHYKFLWGPQAYVETSKWQVRVFLLRVSKKALRTFPPLSAEAEGAEEEGA